MIDSQVLKREYVFTIKRGGGGGLQRFQVSGPPGMTILEALISVYQHTDESLCFRYSCTVGRCYSCLLQMNGRTVVSCREPMVNDALLEPTPNRTEIRDLATEDSFSRVPSVAGVAANSSVQPSHSSPEPGSPLPQ